jgi:hypothetical protein
MTDVDNDKLGALVGKMLGDLGGAFSVPTAGIGFRLGLFDTLHHDGPASVSDLAKRTGLAERCVREWALAQAANGYISFDRQRQRFSLTPEQAMVFAIKDSPVYLEGAFDLAAAMVEGRPKVEAAFKDGNGVAWGDRSGCLFCAGRLILSARLRQQHRTIVASRAGRHAEEAAKRHQGRGYRLRRWLFDTLDGESVPRELIHRL